MGESCKWILVAAVVILLVTGSFLGALVIGAITIGAVIGIAVAVSPILLLIAICRFLKR